MENLVGKRFGKLIVIKQDLSMHKNRRRYWICQCDCGNISSPIDTSSLKNGNTKSCGCLKRIAGTENLSKVDNTDNLIGRRFGKLTVIRKDDSCHNDGFAYWICQCDCGNLSKPIRGQSLKDGYTKSCGCIKSLGNTVIKNILLKLNISFCEEYSFEDLYGNNRPLRFDFAILDESGEIKYLIEYQGQQHYEPSSYFGGQEQFQKQIKYDKMKEEYCLKNNLKLIIIPYVDFELLDEEYLLKRMV